MVVDDNSSLAKSLLNLLRNEGFDPLIFESGQPALDYIRRSRPDLALIDIHLPDISGLEIARQLRQAYGPKLPIIICSGDSSLDALLALPDVGATHFFHKPVSASRLMECLKEAAKGLRPAHDGAAAEPGVSYPGEFESTALQ
jgi:DNA-binding response OmpR family regulator